MSRAVGARSEPGPSECAGEDSNLHGVIPHKALNLARLPIPPPALEGGAEHIASLLPSAARVTFPNTCSPCVHPTSEARHGPDEAPAGDLRLHQALFVRARLPSDGPRHRQGG